MFGRDRTLQTLQMLTIVYTVVIKINFQQNRSYKILLFSIYFYANCTVEKYVFSLETKCINQYKYLAELQLVFQLFIP